MTSLAIKYWYSKYHQRTDILRIQGRNPVTLKAPPANSKVLTLEDWVTSEDWMLKDEEPLI